MEEIVKVIRVDTKGSDKTINQLKKEIKDLKTQLESTAVGSAEFSAKLQALARVQQQYASINADVAVRTQGLEKSFKNVSQFGTNLAKSFSSISAMVGLLGGNADDANKALLKVAQTMQLIQGMSGFGQAIGQLPKIVAQFRDWADTLLPINKRVGDIAASLNGLDTKALTSLEKIASGGMNINVPSTTTTASAGSREVIPSLQEENKAITRNTAILGEQKELYDQLAERRAQAAQDMERLSGKIEEYSKKEAAAVKVRDHLKNKTEQLENAVKSYDKVVDSAIVSGSNDYLAEAKDALTSYEKELEKTTAKYKHSQEAVEEYSKTTKQLREEFKQAEDTAKSCGKQMSQLEKTAGRAAQGIGSFAKTVAKFTAITLAITAVIAALEKLGKVVKRTYENWAYSSSQAKKAQDTINSGLKQTAQLASRPIAVLYELAIAYKKVGDSANEKAKFIKTYADKIKETGIEINDVKKAEEVFINNTDKYVEALMARAKAQAIENTATKLYQEYLESQDELEKEVVKKRGVNKEQFIALLVNTGTSLEDAERAWYESADKDVKAIFRKMDINEKAINARLKRLYEDVADLNQKYSGAFTTTATTNTNAGKEKERELEELEKYYKQALDTFKDARTKELDAVAEKYDKEIDLAKKYGKDTTLLELARQKEVNDIIKKYDDQALKDQEDKAKKQLDDLQNQIERIRKMQMTSNLRYREQDYRTEYRQPSITQALGLGSAWKNTYQSKDDVDQQLITQLEYNNKVLALTKARIEQENQLLQQQLTIEGLSADQRLEIERTLAENKIALDDAVAKNEEDNLNAYLDHQRKRQQAMNATLEVASSVFGSLASISQNEMNNDKRSDRERKKAANAYATMSIAQATVDTYKSANEAYAAMASIPYVGPALGTAAAGAAILAGIANVKQIIQTAQQAKLSASASLSLNSASSITPPTMDLNPVTYTRNLLGDKETEELNNPIRCYVLESDITTTQARVEVRESNASF